MYGVFFFFFEVIQHHPVSHYKQSGAPRAEGHAILISQAVRLKIERKCTLHEENIR